METQLFNKKGLSVHSWAFRNDYESKKWEFCGEPFDPDIHVDNGEYRYTWARLTREQLQNAFEEDSIFSAPENSYGYVMLKNDRVRQCNW